MRKFHNDRLAEEEQRASAGLVVVQLAWRQEVLQGMRAISRWLRALDKKKRRNANDKK
jgi:hypothetical protein